MTYSTLLFSALWSFFFFLIPEAALCACLCTSVRLRGSLCPPQSAVAVGAKPLHQRAVCLSAQCEGNNLYPARLVPSLQRVSPLC